MSVVKKISENRKFIITEDESIIYIKDEFVNEIQSSNKFIFEIMTEQRKEKRNKELKDYTKFTNNLNFKKTKNDCLILAESLISKNIYNPEYKKSKLRVFEKKRRLFGYTYKQNTEIAQDLNKEENKRDYKKINPDIMEAYAIIPVESTEDMDVCPYHVSAVILKDGNTNITLEADSGCYKLKKPVFDMYYTNMEEKSFYERYKNMYTINEKEPVVGVLKLREDES